ncbi:MAG: tetratricopeptide repeat protein [Bacteroidetes bacterium]|nr:tetratricopeptide repeat protein [Bacteroidota bacterium]
MKTYKNVFCIVLCSIWSMSALAQSTSIAEGNSEYEKGRYFNAESSYRKALEKDQRMYEGNYNLGNALYKQNKFEEASQQYMNASVYKQNS